MKILNMGRRTGVLAFTGTVYWAHCLYYRALYTGDLAALYGQFLCQRVNYRQTDDDRQMTEQTEERTFYWNTISWSFYISSRGHAFINASTCIASIAGDSLLGVNLALHFSPMLMYSQVLAFYGSLVISYHRMAQCHGVMAPCDSRAPHISRYCSRDMP